jgi:hypothetical protein
VVVGDQLPAAFERLQQRDRPVRADQRDRGVDLDHRQPPPGRGDRVALVGVRLFPDPQGVDFGLPGGAVDHRRHRGRVVAPVVEVGFSCCRPLRSLLSSGSARMGLTGLSSAEASDHRRVETDRDRLQHAGSRSAWARRRARAWRR